MSIHLLECAAAIKRLEPSWKLALMAFADSADRQERIGFPGLPQVLLWSGLSRSRAFEVINELEQMGLLRKHRAGGGGRRAEYIVLPNGCGRGCCEPISASGSDASDSAGGPGSDAPDPELSGSDRPDAGEGQGPAQTGPSGSDEGPTDRTPSPTTTTNPPTPQAAAGHHGQHANCRGCGTNLRGTSPEDLERERLREAAEQRRARSDAEIQADRRLKAETAHVDHAAGAREARELLAAAQSQGADQ